jgi:uncharacterized protein YjbJ (UPF0337 family)
MNREREFLVDSQSSTKPCGHSSICHRRNGPWWIGSTKWNSGSRVMMRKLLLALVLQSLIATQATAATGDGQLTQTSPQAVTAPARVALNWDEVSGRWKQFTGKARQKWGKLTDDDLAVAAGRREELVGKIQERYGISKDEANRQVDSWIRSIDP